jgi:DNA-binding transcriptional LysR family regulator
MQERVVNGSMLHEAIPKARTVHRADAARRAPARTLTPDALDWIALDLGQGLHSDSAHVLAHSQSEPRLCTNGHLAQVEAVRAGLGVALLARSVLHIDPNLMAIDVGLPPGPALELWLIAPSSLIRLPRVRAVWDFLDARMGALQTMG